MHCVLTYIKKKVWNDLLYVMILAIWLTICLATVHVPKSNVSIFLDIVTMKTCKLA